MMPTCTEMQEPARPIVSDLDSQHEEPRSKWLGCVGWAVVLAFVAFPFGIVFGDFLRSSRAEAEFQRRWDDEARRRAALLQQMARGNAEQRRIAREIQATSRRLP